MNRQKIKEIANAVLYEGYLLYPYRASAVKNRQRWNFGVLYPQAFAEAQSGADRWNTQTECLAHHVGPEPALNITVRFLQLIERNDGWQESTERDVMLENLRLSELASQPVYHAFSYPGSCQSGDGFIRTRESIEGVIDVRVEQLASNGLFKIRVDVSNTTLFEGTNPCDRNRALLRSLASAHTILELQEGEFISLLDPPEEYRDFAARCRNIGTYPVLVGDEGQRDAIFSSPIILYDFPQIAPESAGTLFDGTEIDEILTLRIMTLSDNEKLEMRATDDRAREILERTESLPPEQLMKMHGVLRGLRPGGRDLP